jgi:hypothetical protein
MVAVEEGRQVSGEDRMMWALLRIVGVGVAVLLVLAMLAGWALAHDHDRPELDQWYASLMQPDNPQTSCCGKADAYWCDDYFAKDGKAFCRITDDRKVVGRPDVPVGTLIEIPPWKLKWEQGGRPIGNPTGHTIVFLSPAGHVFCLVQNTGT